jgi:hypothetical protein
LFASSPRTAAATFAEEESQRFGLVSVRTTQLRVLDAIDE